MGLTKQELRRGNGLLQRLRSLLTELLKQLTAVIERIDQTGQKRILPLLVSLAAQRGDPLQTKCQRLALLRLQHQSQQIFDQGDLGRARHRLTE